MQNTKKSCNNCKVYNQNVEHKNCSECQDYGNYEGWVSKREVKDKLSDECGFKITCLDCGRIIELKNYANDIFRMKKITIAQVRDCTEIECECGNQISCYYGE